jgi:hypothetical protein
MKELCATTHKACCISQGAKKRYQSDLWGLNVQRTERWDTKVHGVKNSGDLLTRVRGSAVYLRTLSPKAAFDESKLSALPRYLLKGTDHVDATSNTGYIPV